MKRLLFTLITCLSLTAAVAQSLSEKYTKERPVVVVCDWDKPPYEFLNDKGQPTGSNIDVVNTVMKELGLPVKFIMKEWSIALKTFERGDADLILANARRYRRAPFVVSENIVNYNRIRVAMHSDSTRMITLKELEREGAVFKPGDYSSFYFMDGDTINTSFMEFQTPKVALLGILNGDYKYYVWGEEPLKWKIKELNLNGITLNDVGIPISELHFIGRDRQLVEEIDDQFSRLKQRGEIANIQDRWLHPEHGVEESSPYLWLILLGVVALIAIIWFFSRLARRHVLNATRASSELNEMMFQALHMGNFTVMQYDIAHDRMTNRYGHVLPDEGLTLEEFASRIHPDQQKEFRQKMRSLMEGRERRFELDKRWNAGTEEAPQWLNFQGHAISELDDVGRPAYIVNAIHDVTQEVEEDLAARNLVHKYQTLTNIPFVAMSFYNREGYIIDTNDKMKELCNMTDDKPENKRFWETLCMFDVPLFRGVYTKDDRHDLLFCQHMEYPEAGIDKYIECQIRPLFGAEGDIVNYFINSFNLTSERQQMNELRQLVRECEQTQERIHQQYDRLHYLLLNSERHLMRSNMQEEVISFYRTPDAPEYTHSFKRFLSILAEEDREPMKRLLYDKTTRTQQLFIIHLILPSKGQPGVVFKITFNPVYNERGEIIGHEGISSDITRFYNTQKALEQETARASDSVRQKSGFMASMTHELRTPLNAIVGFTGVLEALGDSPDRGEYVRIIRNSSDMLQRLINDIIEASTITDGAFTIEPADIDFAKAFNDICITLEQRVQAPAVTFLKENPYEKFLTTLDVGRIQQVLTNFVTNAVKFTTEGHIKVGYQYKEKGLYCYCEDTGAGIPESKQRMVFDRFVKLDEFVQGTGMGLAISKSIVERFGGGIGLTSEGEGKGTTFWFWIPCERRLS